MTEEATTDTAGEATSTEATSTEATSESWYSGLDTATHESLKNYGTLDSFVKSGLEAQSKIGTMTSLPTSDSNEDEWNSFYTKAGRPETVDGYEWSAPEGQEVSQDMINHFGPVMHTAGLSSKQQLAMMEAWNVVNADAGAADEKAYQSEVDLLKSELGDKAEAKSLAAENAIKQFAPTPEIAEQMLGFMDNPALARFAIALAEKTMSDDTITDVEATSVNSNGALEKEYHELINNHDGDAYSSDRKVSNKAKARIKEIAEQIYG